ncbi:thrombospondin [Plantactinospora mayteni]|nr:thrombospondin [Plantactinospora mayteni]
MRHSEPAPERDENRDGRDRRDERADSRGGRVDGRDGRGGGDRGDGGRSSGAGTVADAGRGRTGSSGRTEERSGAARSGDSARHGDSAKHRAGTTVAEPGTTPRTAPPVAPTPPVGTRAETRRDADRTAEPERGLGERTPEAEPVVVDRGPRPRASMLATLSLVLGVAAAAFVLAGALAGYGIVLGTLALLLGVGGVSATARRHVAGRTDALIGIVLGVGAVVVAVLAMTGQFDWPTTDGDTVVRLREWLDSQFVDRF